MKNLITKFIKTWQSDEELRKGAGASILLLAAVILVIALLLATADIPAPLGPHEAYYGPRMQKEEDITVKDAMFQAYRAGYEAGVIEGIKVGLGVQNTPGYNYAGAGDNALQKEETK
jgi:hypothetical protein